MFIMYKVAQFLLPYIARLLLVIFTLFGLTETTEAIDMPREDIKIKYEIENNQNTKYNKERKFPIIIVSDESNDAIIYVGDSRTVGMDNATKDIQEEYEYFVAEIGKGYNWLVDEGVSEVDRIISETDYDNYIIVFSLGVNDLYNYNKYIEYYKYLKDDKYKDYDLYFCTVNPVIDGKSNATMEGVCTFNDKLNDLINIDTYNYIIDDFYAPDGLHYDSDTYIKIYEKIKEELC